MPSRNRVKKYVAGGYYHLYNRGVEKRLVFMDEQDYGVFLGYLKLYLSSPTVPGRAHIDLSNQIELVAYCLMPNHFHLLVRQYADRGIERLMRCLMTCYVRYFNTRYDRVGALFQDIYKAVYITDELHLHQAEEYIHKNPEGLVKNTREYPYSSLRWKSRPPDWLKPI